MVIPRAAKCFVDGYPRLKAQTCISDLNEAERLYAAQGSTPLGVYVALADCYRMARRDADKNLACEMAKKIQPVTAADRLDEAVRKKMCAYCINRFRRTRCSR